MLHVLAIDHVIPGRFFSIERDGGFAEMFQYSQAVCLTLVIINIALLLGMKTT